MRAAWVDQGRWRVEWSALICSLLLHVTRKDCGKDCGNPSSHFYCPLTFFVYFFVTVWLLLSSSCCY